MKKIISVLVASVMIFTYFGVCALDIENAYDEFKAAHPEFIDSFVNSGISEDTITAFISDVYDYLMEINSYTPVTKDNFEKNAMQAIMDVSSREAYYSIQDTMLILYPDAIKLAVSEGKVSEDFQPLVDTIKDILFDEITFTGTNGSTASNGKSDSGSSDNTPVSQNNPFTDINRSHWAYTSVKYLADNFILNGYYDGTFKPENNITRAEFAKIIVSAADAYDVNSASAFTDVSEDDWYYVYVSTAYSLGYIKGYPDGGFHPEDNITRADICTIVNRVLNALPDGSVSAFADDWAIPAYARDSVYALAAKGIINGYTDGTFIPTAYATRAQTAKIIYSAFFQK